LSFRIDIAKPHRLLLFPSAPSDCPCVISESKG